MNNRRAVSVFSLVIFFAGACFAMSADIGSVALKYVKKNTRQATLEASLRASGLPVLGEWYQIGPFDPVLRRPQQPEEHPVFDAEYSLYGGGKSRWRMEPAYLDGYANAIRSDGIKKAILAKQPTICLGRKITAAASTSPRIFLGSDSGFMLSLNGKPVLYNDTITTLEPGQETVALPLEAGENLVVLKVKLTKQPSRFFFLPDFGPGVTEDLLGRLARDFPVDGEPMTGYRARAKVVSSGAEDRYYRLTEIQTPPGVFLEGGGLDFLPDGRLAVCTRRGYVYLVENPRSEDPDEIRFTRFAQGLHEPLGLGVFDGVLYVVSRGELTRLLDTDEDGIADRFECVSNGWGISGNYHEYAYGLAADREKNLYIPLNISFPSGGPASAAPYRGWVVRITPAGEMEPFCYGFRSPNGIGTNAEGDIFVTDNQGEWVPSSPVYHIRKDHFYGHPVSIRWTKEALARGYAPTYKEKPDRPRTPPAVWMPYEELSQSATDIVCDQTGGVFGPFREQLFVGDMTKGLIVRVQLEKIGGEYQGACYLFRRGCGAVNRMTFGPNGDLYLTRVNRGWGGGGRGDGLARLGFTGRVPMEIKSTHVRRDGFELRFTKPLAQNLSLGPDQLWMEQYRYHNWSTYGSPKIDRRIIEITGLTISSDRLSLRIVTTDLEPGKVCRIKLPRLRAEDGEVLLHNEAFYTLNRFPE